MTEGPWDREEYANWKDRGCRLHPSCLECPLACCIEDMPRARSQGRLDARNAAMRGMKLRGSSLKAIAAAFRVSVRTVQRALIVQNPKV
jgi:hypothetical protein